MFRYKLTGIIFLCLFLCQVIHESGEDYINVSDAPPPPTSCVGSWDIIGEEIQRSFAKAGDDRHSSVAKKKETNYPKVKL